jgi:hypothetical protein
LEICVGKVDISWLAKIFKTGHKFFIIHGKSTFFVQNKVARITKIVTVAL